MTITFDKKGNTVTVKTKHGNISFNDRLIVGEKELPGPGEYEVSGIFFENEPDVSHFHAESMVVAYLHPGKKKLDEKDIEKLENVDVVLVGIDTDSVEELKRAVDFANQIDPRVLVIVGAQNTEIAGKIEGPKPEVVSEIKLEKTSLPEEERLVYVLI